MAFTPITKGDYKNSVKACPVGNVSIAAPGTSTFDGVSVSTGDRLLLKEQTLGQQNGLYRFNGPASPLTRPDDADTSDEVGPGTIVYVEQGTANGAKWWYITTPTPVVLGTTPLTFTQLGAGGASASDIAAAKKWAFTIS